MFSDANMCYYIELIFHHEFIKLQANVTQKGTKSHLWCWVFILNLETCTAKGEVNHLEEPFLKCAYTLGVYIDKRYRKCDKGVKTMVDFNQMDDQRKL